VFSQSSSNHPQAQRGCNGIPAFAGMMINNNTVLCKLVLFILFISVSVLSARTFPQDFEYSYVTEVLLDAGINWEDNSTFHPFEYVNYDSVHANRPSLHSFQWVENYLSDYAVIANKLHDHSAKGLGLSLTPGVWLSRQNGVSPEYRSLAVNYYYWMTFSLYSNWYFQFFVRYTSAAESVPHYTGKSQEIDRIGFSTGEIDQSVFGYKNDWVNIEYGRSREIWGPLTEDNILLSGNSPAYDRIMMQMTYQRFSYRWFYGFLEAILSDDNLNINRYIVGRALEYNNHRDLVLSIGEVSILSGPNRPADWAFLNPFAAHIEIEQNKRENYAENNWSNDILFFNVDWLLIPSLRFSGSFALDELQVDRSAREAGFGDGLGFMGRFAWTPKREQIGATLFGYYLRIDSFTMQHQYGFANLVSRGELIGHPLGNDMDELALGLRIVSKLPAIFELKLGQRRWGDNSLLNDPYASYDDHIQDSFPMGEMRTTKFAGLKIKYEPYRNLHFGLDGQFDLKHSGTDSELELWTFTLRYQIPLHWLL